MCAHNLLCKFKLVADDFYLGLRSIIPDEKLGQLAPFACVGIHHARGKDPLDIEAVVDAIKDYKKNNRVKPELGIELRTIDKNYALKDYQKIIRGVLED